MFEDDGGLGDEVPLGNLEGEPSSTFCIECCVAVPVSVVRACCLSLHLRMLLCCP